MNYQPNLNTVIRYIVGFFIEHRQIISIINLGEGAGDLQ